MRWLALLNAFQLNFDYFLFKMGSFRSAPDLNKHKIVKSGLGLTYAVAHMCGTPIANI